MASVDGKQVTVGDYVSFKGDIEACGKIIKVDGRWLDIETDDGMGNVAVHTEVATRCWLEGQ